MAKCDWYGYYEWHYPADLKRNSRYKNTNTLRVAGKISEQLSPLPETDDEAKEKYRHMVKVWKIWDLREKMRMVFTDGGEKFLLEEPMDVRRDGSPILPHAILRYHNRLKNEFYPVPPVYNWISPQNELNETREMQKVHRKRFIRKFQSVNGAVEEGEQEKWESGGDGTLIKTTRENAITPITDAPLDPTVVRNIPQTKEDFTEISGVTGEQQGVSEADTATQANIMDVQSRIRESKARVQVADFLADLAKAAMEIVERRMTLPFWISTNVDLNSPAAPVEAAEVAKTWQTITRDDLGSLDYDVVVDVDSMTPVVEAGERNGWMQALQIVANPVSGPMILGSELLLRKTLGYFGVHNEKDIAALKQYGQQMLMLQMMAQQQQQGATTQQGGEAAPGPTPDNADIAGQLSQQIGTSQQIV